MSKNTARLQKLLFEFAADDFEEYLKFISGMFVGAFKFYVEEQGADPEKEITVNNPNGRDITIHPRKHAASGEQK